MKKNYIIPNMDVLAMDDDENVIATSGTYEDENKVNLEYCEETQSETTGIWQMDDFSIK